MQDNDRKILLTEAIRIGDEISTLANTSPAGISWETKGQRDGTWGWSTQLPLYQGVTGFVLLFLELYKLTSDKSYLQNAEGGARWVIDTCRNQSRLQMGSFFTGTLGALYVLQQVSDVTGDSYYAETAMNILLNSKTSEGTPDDLLNGTAGIVMGLMMLDEINNYDQTLASIDYYLGGLLNRAFLDKRGVYWDRTGTSITGLCGYSHGASGMAYVFMQLAHYFQNPAYDMLAREALAYENAHYNRQMRSWPDLRKMNYNETTEKLFRQNFEKRNLSFFLKGNDFTGWCHGATGIAITRALAVERLDRRGFHGELEGAWRKMETAPHYGSYTLCHGLGANVMLYLDRYLSTGNKKYYDASVTLAVNAVGSFRASGKYTDGFNCPEIGEDTSLFNGRAGIAYSMLRVLSPASVFNVLAPRVTSRVPKKRLDKKKYPNILIDQSDLRRKILRSYFPLTLSASKTSKNFYVKCPLNAKLTNVVGKLKTGNRNGQTLELAKYSLEASIKSWALFDYETKHQRQKAANVNGSKLRLSKYVKLMTLGATPSDSQKMIIFLNLNTCRANYMEISDFEFDVLSKFRRPRDIEEVASSVSSLYGPSADGGDEQIRKIFDACVRNSLQASFLHVE